MATTIAPADDIIAKTCEQLGVPVFRGSERDVLDRYARAAEMVAADIVVRSTADCPLIDPDVVDRVLARLRADRCDYASNTLIRTFPRGLDVEAMRTEALLVARRESIDPLDREHVTRYIHQHPERFRLRSVELDRNLSAERWTVDTREDLELIRRVIEILYPICPAFGMQDVIDLLDAQPDWRQLNAHVEQKHV